MKVLLKDKLFKFLLHVNVIFIADNFRMRFSNKWMFILQMVRSWLACHMPSMLSRSLPLLQLHLCQLKRYSIHLMHPRLPFCFINLSKQPILSDLWKLWKRLQSLWQTPRMSRLPFKHKRILSNSFKFNLKTNFQFPNLSEYFCIILILKIGCSNNKVCQMCENS